jgi:DNA-binding protein Fis
MLTILISEEDKKVKALVGSLLRQEGYAIPEDWDKQGNVVKIAQNEAVHDLDSLRDKVIAMEEALYRDKYGVLYKSILEAVERPLIEHVLRRTEGNQFKAARILGINRNTMRAKIKKLGINLDK